MSQMCEMQHVHLQVLNLDFCTLSELPASLGQLTALTTLDVEGNPYLGETFRPDNMAMPPAFPAELSGLQALKYINLNSCGLTSVPEVGFTSSPSTLCEPQLACLCSLLTQHLCMP